MRHVAIALAVLLLATPALATEEAMETIFNSPGPTWEQQPVVPIPPPAPDNVICYDNGPLITHPGACGTNSDSWLQTALGLNVYGFAHQPPTFRVADDFTLTAPCEVGALYFYAYQTGAGTTSTITGVNFRVWGAAGPGIGTPILDCSGVNTMAATNFAGIHRSLDTAPCATNRNQMEQVCIPCGALNLAAGTYWLDWQTTGSLSSGPWAAPVTILNQCNSPGSNGKQYNGTSWVPVLDSGLNPPCGGSPQDFPFKIEGVQATPTAPSTWGTIKNLY